MLDLWSMIDFRLSESAAGFSLTQLNQVSVWFNMNRTHSDPYWRLAGLHSSSWNSSFSQTLLFSLTNKISDTDIVAKLTIIQQSASAKFNKVHKFSRGFSFLSDKNKNSFKLRNQIQRNICSETSWWQAAGTEPKHLILCPLTSDLYFHATTGRPSSCLDRISHILKL